MNRSPQNAIESRTQKGKSKRNKPDRRWTILFIGDHGKQIPIKRFKGMVIFTGLVFVLLVAAIVLLFWYSQSINRKYDKLESSLDLFQKRIQTLSHEKEILMARLVLAESRVKESRVKENIDNTQDTEAPKPSIANEKNEPSQEKSVEVAAKKNKTPAVIPPAKPKPVTEQPDINYSVHVEDFNILKLSNPDKIKIQYKIKNTSPNRQRVSGHTIVVLKGDELKPKMWLPVPPIGLVGGKPTGKQQGYGFSINNFRTMRFTTNTPQSPLEYNKAAVYVYTGKGKLLLEQEFPAEIPAPWPPVPESSSSSRSASSSSERPPARIIGDPKQTSESPPTGEQTSGSSDRLPVY